MNRHSIRLRELRCGKGLTQKEVADALRISPSVYNMDERGNREPCLDMIEKIAGYFNVSPAYLVGWDEKKEPAGSITITVRFNGNDFTEEEMERIKTFAKMLKKKGDANGENQ